MSGPADNRPPNHRGRRAILSAASRRQALALLRYCAGAQDWGRPPGRDVLFEVAAALERGARASAVVAALESAGREAPGDLETQARILGRALRRVSVQ